jgi:hypothetical protein
VLAPPWGTETWVAVTITAGAVLGSTTMGTGGDSVEPPLVSYACAWIE